jgi:hypothetical protein
MPSKRQSESALLADLFEYLDDFESLIADVDRDRHVVLINAPDSAPPSQMLITAAEFARMYTRLLPSAVSDPTNGSLKKRVFNLFSVLLQEAAWDMSEPGRYGYKLVDCEFVPWESLY